MYPHCDSWALSWSYRKSVLLKEIVQNDADILCLQEVQADHFEKDLSPFMNSLNFSGHYDQKTREAMGQYGKVRLFEIYYYYYC